jgi:hypothetical protein
MLKFVDFLMKKKQTEPNAHSSCFFLQVGQAEFRGITADAG